MPAKCVVVPMILLHLWACRAGADGPKEHTWVWSVADGCKPGGAIVLTEKNGEVTYVRCCILDPNYPHDVTKGVAYPITNLAYKDGVIKGDLTVINGASKTGIETSHLVITLKGSLKGDTVRAEVQDQEDGEKKLSEKKPVVFTRK